MNAAALRAREEALAKEHRQRQEAEEREREAYVRQNAPLNVHKSAGTQTP